MGQRGSLEGQGRDGIVRMPSAQGLAILRVGYCEPLKAAVHGLLLATAGVCVAYNGAAWIMRRERHLAVNTVLYFLVVGWEHRHVRQHLTCRPAVPAPALRDAA
jgi:hypothetical protein